MEAVYNRDLLIDKYNNLTSNNPFDSFVEVSNDPAFREALESYAMEHGGIIDNLYLLFHGNFNSIQLGDDDPANRNYKILYSWEVKDLFNNVQINNIIWV